MTLFPSDYAILALAAAGAITGLFTGFSGALGMLAGTVGGTFAGRCCWGLSAAYLSASWQRALAVMVATRWTALETVLFAVTAGALEDALSGLAPMTSVSYFLAVASFARWSGLPRLAVAFTYPGYQIWLAVWTVGMGGNVYARTLMAFPIGLVTAFAVGAALTLLFRKAAIDEQG